jgi:hypothetical protein
MKKTLRILKDSVLLIFASFALSATANAQVDVDEPRAEGMRAELWVAATSWSKLGDLEPVAGGTFDSVGYGIGGSVHWPWKSMPNASLMVGVEGAVMATESNVPVLYDDLLARDAYLAASIKWQIGEARNLSLDAGLAYHLLDIAQIEMYYNSYSELQSWEESAFGPFVGMTWDVGATGPQRDSGLTLGLRTHFVDFGTVRDEEVFFSPVLGADAGELKGPIYALQVGYGWR